MKNLKDLNLVLDIDSTLVNTFEDIDSIYKLLDAEDDELRHLTTQSYCFNFSDRDETGKIVPCHMWGFFRPYLLEFLLYCIENFKNVYVWTAGCKKYADGIVELLFKNFNYTPPLVFSGEDTYIDEERDVVLKPLDKIYDRSNGEADKFNTIILDDREDVFKDNPDNGLLIPRFAFDDKAAEYDGHEETMKSIIRYIKEDKCLQELIVFFEKNKNISSAQELIQNNIFTCISAIEEDFSTKFKPKIRRRKVSPCYK